MFTDMTMITLEADAHRGRLMAEAAEHRLATVAKASRRALRRAADDAVARWAAAPAGHDGQPPPPEPHRPGSTELSTAGEVCGNRR